MKKIFLYLLVFSISTGCMTTRKFDKIMTSAINNYDIQNVQMAENIIFDRNITDSSFVLSKNEKIKSQFIPALFFWKWDNTIEFNIKQQYLEEFLIKSFYENERISELQKKLKGNTLKLNIKDLPNQYFYTNKGEILILILFYQVGTLKAIYPLDYSLLINYEIIDSNNSVVKSSDVNIERKTVPTDNTDGSTKYLAKKHLGKYETNIKYMTDDLIKQIIKEI